MGEPKEKLIGIWLSSPSTPRPVAGPTEIRVEWDNDTHHAVEIKAPQDKESVINAFYELLGILNYEAHVERST